MTSTLVKIPIALVISVLLGHSLLQYLHLSEQLLWLIPIGLLGAWILHQRKPLDLGLIGAGALLAAPQTESLERLGIAGDTFLALAIALTLLPAILGLLGLEYSTPTSRIS